ncbi:hypothetical protein NE857_34090 (plasmid) [Nocardiopsis exhalans]|uniref:SWIM-type domain-containing protein n=1 Tax=Nocardiopsis exhalans TaxID=163604 RepID=A0ABY5DHW1_9ACTN|nr:hypothetical protein [Nocardiopsis exhalans]USY23565.1 hypothetical protein NE857_34090 [Nocardiopsis exhalans]
MQDYDEMPSGHLASAVNAYNAPQIPEQTPPLPAPEGAGAGRAEVLVPGKTYQATYTTDWNQGARTTYQVQGVGAFELCANLMCHLCGHDEWGRPRPCRHVQVTYGRGPRYTPQDQRQDLPVINRVTLVGACSLDPHRAVPKYFPARRPRGPYQTEEAPDKTAAKLAVLVHALVQHWDRLPEAPQLRAGAVRALAARRYREAVAEQQTIRERIARERILLERAEAAASHQADLATASSYDQVVELMHRPPAPRREYSVFAVCDGSPGDEPTVVMMTRALVMSEYDDEEGHGAVVCTDVVSASSPQEAAQIFTEDHHKRHGI